MIPHENRFHSRFDLWAKLLTYAFGHDLMPFGAYKEPLPNAGHMRPLSEKERAMRKRAAVQNTLDSFRNSCTDQVDMSCWVEIDEVPVSPFRVVQLTGECNTVGCAMGHSALANQWALQLVLENHDDPYDSNDVYLCLALSIFDINEDHFSYLSDRDCWPDEYQDMGDKAGCIAIFERALSEGSFKFLWEG
jgi:hypothetical protein